MELNESMSVGLCNLLCFRISCLQYDTTEHIIQSAQKEKGKELTLAEKLAVLKILADKDFEIDFSGGDPLYYDEDFRVVEQATRWLPARKIGVSMTSSKITDVKLELLKKVSVVGFTLDNLPEKENAFRPSRI